MNKIATFVSAMAAVGMAGSVMAATPITVTQTVNASQFTTTQQQSRVGPGTTTFIGTVSSTGPTLIPISRFDTNTGILVGARMSVTLPYTVSVSATGAIPASGSGRTVDVTSGISGTVSIGGTSISTTSFAATPKCNSGDCLNQSSNNTSSTTGTLSGTTAVASSNLVNLAGTGAGSVNFSTSVSNSNTRIINGSGVTTGFARSAFVVGGATAASNVYSVAYDYLNFANPSFSNSSTVTSSSLNFGSLALGSGPALLNFNITNIGNINTAGLSLTSISRSTSNSQFTSTISTFTNGLDGGFTNNYSISFNPLVVGTVNDIFTFTFADFAPTGSVGGRNYTLTMNVAGDVFDPVPEPASWMMMMLGFGLVGSIARRRAVSQPG
ncbi:PEPxxWA-CTERM sorting domain-containing protein [Sandarakinorhabdus sp.]|uniref:PEPxxWA-CTERM sorting domain-containing protein n=1 Tax=Sandarakinorhabdus sp. TaxID=1916663 RepID=UPI00286D719D|nr:PEPxxWA-CTERM sorting domain-containing protein [Sandarakinorhabdus sp.]